MPVFNPADPDVRRADSRQMQELIDEARAALDVLENGRRPTKEQPSRVMTIGDLAELVRVRRRTGEPGGSRRGDSGPGSVLDDEGRPMPPVHDPVGEHVAAKMTDRKTTDIALATVLRCLRGAVGDLRVASGALARATPTTEVSPEGDPGCRVHALYGKWEPVDPKRPGTERCERCYRFWLAEGVDPPAPIIQAWLDGRRLNVKMVKEALTPDPPKRHKKGRARR